MSYWEEEVETPKTLKAFIRSIQFRETVLNEGDQLGACFICTENIANGKIGSRLCLCSRLACEGTFS